MQLSPHKHDKYIKDESFYHVFVCSILCGEFVMGSVLEFRRDSASIARISRKKKKKSKLKMGQIIIFPGIRRERHSDDYLTDKSDEKLNKDNKNAS